MYVDLDSLKSHFDGDEELIGELVEVFEETYPETLANIEKAINDQSTKDLELHAHTLKGMLANFFVDKLKELAFQLEKIGREGNLGDVSDQAEQLKSEIPKMLAELKNIG